MPIFKVGSSEQEIIKSMHSNLIKSQIEKEHSFDKIAKATDLLNDAAFIFEKAGMVKEAAEIIDVLSEITEKVRGRND